MRDVSFACIVCGQSVEACVDREADSRRAGARIIKEFGNCLGYWRRVPMKPLSLAVLAWLFASGPAASQTVDVVKGKLDKAKALHKEETDKLRAEVAAYFDKREETARKKGDLKQVEKIKSEREAFDEKSELPPTAPPALKKKYRAAQAKLGHAYGEAVKAYTKAGKDTEAAAVEQEFAGFRKSTESEVEFLSSMTPTEVKAQNGWFEKNGTIFGKKIAVKKKESPHGLFLHPPAKSYAHVSFDIGARWEVFRGEVAVNRTEDNQRPPDSPLIFEVVGDGKALWRSQPVARFDEPQSCEVKIRGVRVLELRVICSGSDGSAHAVWLEPRVSRSQ